MRRFALYTGAVLSALAGIAAAPYHEVVSNLRPEPKRRVMVPGLFVETNRKQRREQRAAVRANKKHRVKGLRP